MKTLQVFILCSFFTLSLYGQPDAIIGEWYTKDNESIVEIYKKGGKYYGKIVWLEEPRNENGELKRDDKNPEAHLRDRPLKGLEIIKGLVYNSDDKEWGDGEVYDPENGKTYSCFAELKNDDVLALRGYIGVSMFGRTAEWRRKK